MSRHAAVTACSDPNRPMPASRGRRLDEAHAALASLREEQRRLERLGLDSALRGCREQLRYWEFLAALFSMEPARPAHPHRTGRAH